MLGERHLTDTPDYGTSNWLYNTSNKNVLGKMKDEMHNIPIHVFVDLK